MDLSAIMNEGSGPAGASSAGRQSSRPPSQHMQQQPPPPQHPGQHHPPPSTPIQNVPPPSFHHDHPQSVQPSPNYHLAHAAPTNFASSPPYGAPTSYGAPGRPPPPPLQQLTTNNSMRSPSAGPAHVPPSPYARTPVAQPRGDSAAYPFPSPGHPHPHPHPHPHQHQDASPVQQHRYIPPNAYPHRDSYSQPSPGPGPGPSPGAMGHGPPPPGYFSSHQVMGPHTPPVGTPGGAHPYLTQQQHSRSTSVQSQQSYPPQQPPFASPVSATRPPPPSEQQPTRQLSQPPTPQQQQQQGPPLSTASRHSGTFAQPQPPSPYQQRVSSSGAPYPPYPAQASLAPHQQQQQQPQPQSQPPPPQTPYQQPLPPQHQSPHVAPRPHPSIQRAPSGYDGAHDQQQHSTRSPVVDPHHRASLSHSERDRSISVSPKTRVPSLPSSVGRHSQASLSGPSEGGPPGDFDPRDPRHLPPHQAPMKDAPSQKSDSALPTALPRADRASTPAKRKLDDRDIKPEDLDRQEPRPPPFQANGAHRPESSARPTAAPVPATRRKPRHLTAPIWSQPYNKQDLHHPNYHLRKTGTSHPRTNGSAEPTNSRQERAASRHVSPEASRGVTANHAPPRPVNPDVATLLGPWEQTFANKKPIDAMVRAVADFLYFNVVSPPELKDLSAQPGIEFEIEAKLGCLVDRNLRDNTRKEFGISTEAVVRDECPFHSSMTEVRFPAVVKRLVFFFWCFFCLDHGMLRSTLDTTTGAT